ncbi:MAG: phosphoserine transaminase [Bdellovibrionales bacterium]|nr:phosphoserine transaminase [Bdellovibrionales bacterium]MBT3525175.1 phosphoserine transaminase [Bdellovibrionales bacterium]MBT7669760.1 phosphoserine transaminase [Bdellovibrionales bacterium]MBT7767875.1 phosphoserine transaminase [Bdellovibrionales bacterium]
MNKPTKKPNRPYFSSGPCSKRPGWTLAALEDNFHSRSHRAKGGKAKLNEVIVKSKEVLGLPSDYHLGIVPASDTGAIEMAMWSLLGERGVDVLGWESFGMTWVKDIKDQLKLTNVNAHTVDGYGQLPDLSKVNFDNDVVFTWNGTTSGVCVPNAEWIPADRKGLTICDATSGVFAMEIDFTKLDVVTWSWQKALGGEGAHGMIALSPRAVERLESYTPSWPMPKIFRLANKGKFAKGIFDGATINTPSLMATEDVLDALNWSSSIGGLPGLIRRSQDNLNVISQWVDQTDWVEFLATEKETRSSTSICLSITHPQFKKLDGDTQKKFVKEVTALIDKEGAGYDINSYKDAPAGLRIWGGATVESSDIGLLLPWIEWAFFATLEKYNQ